MNNFPKPSIFSLKSIWLSESQIKVWLLEKTILFNFFSNFSIIDKAGSAVQEINKASLPSNSISDKSLNKLSWSTFPISRSDGMS